MTDLFNHPISRRAAIRSVAGTSLFAGGWLNSAKPAAANSQPRAKSVILIFNCGAPSHLDLWDMKPNASSEVRGEWSPIDTVVPGIQISEKLPRLARHADKLAIVRTLHHQHSSHNSGMYWSIVGRPYHINSTLINPSRTDYPSFGTLTGWLAQKNGYTNPLPPYVITPAPHCDSKVYLTPGQFGACLGSKYDPFVLDSDPNAKDFRVPNLAPPEGFSAERLIQRQSLLGEFDNRGHPIAAPLVEELETNRRKAISLITSNDVGTAFDLSQEPDDVRERYGRHTWGQSHLLARRLVEAGVPFVTTVNGQSIVWDTHKDNFGRLKNSLIPPMETAYATLLEDLEERGLLDSTLVVWMGDFGRTPLINKEAGRDHWPQCYSMVLAGGGIRGGQVVGESDKTGAVPLLRPVTPADIHATIFTALGYDPHGITYHTADGRPTPLSEGDVVTELL
ncbi:MAG: DUF1501 domain-containing protein [Planctomycetota bacterium]|nr:DUF1501 domain-containing protein [Planctomycetota bacterium]MDA1211376.1 DUF1501 domain-containing protein [Planctomycetota bacterium]